MRTMLLATGLLLLMSLGCDRNETVIKASSGNLNLYGIGGPASLEEMVLRADVIVRARFNSARAVGVKPPGQDGFYVAALEITFNVLEYLKGPNTGTTIKGVAPGFYIGFDYTGLQADTAAEAAKLATPLHEWRDKRWDQREAIVMLSNLADRDYLYVGHIANQQRKITVADAAFKRWLPIALATADNTGMRTSRARSATERYFLTDEPVESTASPSTRSAGQQQQAPEQPNISLTAFKSLIANVDRQVAVGGGSEEYRKCLAETLYKNRTGDLHYMHYTGTIESGLPVGNQGGGQG